MIQLSGLSPSSVEIAPGLPATATRMFSVAHEEPLRFGQPRLMLFTRSSLEDGPAKPVVYVVRYRFKPPPGQDDGGKDSDK